MTATQLTALEIATGLVFGPGPDIAPADAAPERIGHLTALERAMLPALRRPPCLVSFSGGRDSSAVLATATLLARREGLPLPIPATNVFRSAPQSDEAEWQERVVSHVGSEDWIRVELEHELEAVGPIARRVLERHGLLWPFNTHFHDPLLAHARGGSLLTGVGGDEVLGRSYWARPASILQRRVRPSPRDALRVGLALSPRWVRRAVLERRAPDGFPWLTPAAGRDLRSAWAAHVATEPMRWGPRWQRWRRLRHVQISIDAFERLAHDHDTRAHHPLADPSFGAAVARFAADARLQTRGDLVEGLFGELLPREVCRRLSKASFDQAFWGPDCRRLAARLRSDWIDHDVVDEDALRREWREPVPDSHTFLLLQSLWLRESTSALTPAA